MHMPSAKASAVALAVLMVLLMVASQLPKQPSHIISNSGSGKSASVYMEIAADDFSRMRGLMFRDRIIPILFVFGSPGLFPIHSHFVKAQFDAVYLSPEGKVVEIFRKIPPNTNLVSPTKQAGYLLELPVETFDQLKIKEGDTIAWKEIREK
jgi:uncharacterized membrane protein (UPF0127 family)